jgi:outer membrane protein
MKRILIPLVILLSVATAAAGQTTPGRGTPPPTTQPAPGRGTPPPTQPPATQTPPLPTQQTPAKPATPAAAPAPFPPDAKIAFVNMQAIVAESKLGKMGQEQMKALRDKNAAALTAKAKAIQDLQQQIQSQQGTLSETALQQKTRELERQQREATALQQQFQSDEQNKNDDLLGDFTEKVMPVIDALRTEKGLWVIFAVQGPEGGGLAVASYNPGVDLSMEIVKRLDAKFPEAGK